MKCQKVKKSFTAYISDELSKNERHEVEMHLQMCCVCQREFASLQATNEMLSVWNEIDPPEELFNKFKAKLVKEAKREEKRTFLRFMWPSSKLLYVSVAAVCLIITLIFSKYIFTKYSWYPEKVTSPGSTYDYNSDIHGNIWVSFYLSEHEKTLKHASFQETTLSHEAPFRIPLKRENMMYYDELSGEREGLKGQSGLILKSEGEWQQKKGLEEELYRKEELYGKVLDGESMTLKDARKSVPFDIVTPSIVHEEYQLALVRKVEDKECIQLVYSSGSSIISVFEQPAQARYQLVRSDFREYIFGLSKNKERIAVLGWISENLSFNLVGELTLSEMMKIADEIQERSVTDKTKQYYQRLYGGEQR